MNHTQRAIGRRLNLEIFELLSGPELRSQPARLPSTARPSLLEVGGISILWKNLGVTLRSAPALRAVSRIPTKPKQSPIKPSFLA
jgi:hypothetical protein